MKDIIFPDGFSLELIHKSHPRKQFLSGLSSVDDWLHTKALQQFNKRLSTTRVLIDSGRQIAGYYTLASKQIDFSDLPGELTHPLPERPLPVALIAWLGIDQRYQGKGLGSRLLARALRECYVAGDTFPFIAVILDCLTEQAKAFYQRWQFEELPDYPMRLFLSYARLKAIIEN